MRVESPATHGPRIEENEVDEVEALKAREAALKQELAELKAREAKQAELRELRNRVAMLEDELRYRKEGRRYPPPSIRRLEQVYPPWYSTQTAELRLPPTIRLRPAVDDRGMLTSGFMRVVE